MGAVWNTFTVELAPSDGERVQQLPPNEAFSFELEIEGQLVDPKWVTHRIHPRPLPRPKEGREPPTGRIFEVSMSVSGEAAPAASFLASPSEIGPPLQATIGCALFGDALGEPAPVRLNASVTTRRKAALAAVNERMRADDARRDAERAAAAAPPAQEAAA